MKKSDVICKGELLDILRTAHHHFGSKPDCHYDYKYLIQIREKIFGHLGSSGKLYDAFVKHFSESYKHCESEYAELVQPPKTTKLDDYIDALAYKELECNYLDEAVDRKKCSAEKSVEAASDVIKKYESKVQLSIYAGPDVPRHDAEDYLIALKNKYISRECDDWLKSGDLFISDSIDVWTQLADSASKICGLKVSVGLKESRIYRNVCKLFSPEFSQELTKLMLEQASLKV